MSMLKSDEFKGWYNNAEEQCMNCRNNKFKLFGYLYCSFDKRFHSLIKLGQIEYCAAQDEKYKI